MKKRLICTLLALSLVVAGFSSCVPSATDNGGSKPTSGDTTSGGSVVVKKDGLPIVDQPLTYEIAASTQKNKNFKELEYFQNLEKETNIIINWNMSSDDGWKEKKSLLFAGTDLPDAFYGQDILTDIDVIKYASQGMLIPLNDLIDDYAPNLKAVLDANPEYRKQITSPDGNIYSLPTINELNPTTHDKLFINKTWLEKLDLEVPETKEDFEAVLQAFKDGDPNGNGNKDDEIPFSFRMSSSDPYNRQQGIQSLFGTFGQLDDIYHFIVNDGNVVYTPQTEPYKEAISWFGSLYKKGLLDQEAFTHDFNVYVAKVQDPSKIVGMFLGWSGNSTAAANKDDYIAMAPLKNSNGEQIWRTVDAKIISRGSFSITNSAQYPEALMRWIDQSYESETSLELCQGLIGRTLELTQDGRYQQMALPDGVTLDTAIHDYSPGNDGTFAMTKVVTDKLNLNANLTERKELDEFYSKYNVPTTGMYPNVFFTEDEIEEIGVLKTDIETYVSQKYAMWIVEGGVEKEWDDFQKKLTDMNVDRYIQIYKDAYARYLGK